MFVCISLEHKRKHSAFLFIFSPCIATRILVLSIYITVTIRGLRCPPAGSPITHSYHHYLSHPKSPPCPDNHTDNPRGYHHRSPLGNHSLSCRHQEKWGEADMTYPASRQFSRRHHRSSPHSLVSQCWVARESERTSSPISSKTIHFSYRCASPARAITNCIACR